MQTHLWDTVMKTDDDGKVICEAMRLPALREEDLIPPSELGRTDPPKTAMSATAKFARVILSSGVLLTLIARFRKYRTDNLFLAVLRQIRPLLRRFFNKFGTYLGGGHDAQSAIL